MADTLEEDVVLLGVTGVDDRLQDGVRQCLETLRNAVSPYVSSDSTPLFCIISRLSLGRARVDAHRRQD